MMVPQEHYALDDPFFRERIRKLIDEYPIDFIIETGLNEGKSTLEFCNMPVSVIGIDIDPICTAITEDRLLNAHKYNYELIVGSSPDILKQITPELNANGNILFFLDAHWGEHITHHWVLPDEILALPKGKGVIALHDIRVPGKDFGYDSYEHNGQVKIFDYENIREYLYQWSFLPEIEYPEQAGGSRRGTAVIYPDKRRTLLHRPTSFQTLVETPNPINHKVFLQTKELINNLPEGLPLPQITGSMDGTVTFTWVDGNGTILKTEVIK